MNSNFIIKHFCTLMLFVFSLFFVSCNQQNNNQNEEKSTDSFTFHEIEPISKLDKQYLKFIDKNGNFTNLKEFNKNGSLLVFVNQDNPDEILVNCSKDFFELCQTFTKSDTNEKHRACNPDEFPSFFIFNLENYTYKQVDAYLLEDGKEQEWINNYFYGKNKNNKIDGIDAKLVFYDLIIFNEEKEQLMQKMFDKTEYLYNYTEEDKEKMIWRAYE